MTEDCPTCRVQREPPKVVKEGTVCGFSHCEDPAVTLVWARISVLEGEGLVTREIPACVGCSRKLGLDFRPGDLSIAEA